MEAPLGFIPLRDAADRVGCRLYASNWCPLDEVFPAPVGPFNLMRGVDADAACKLTPEVERVITMIAEACERGEIASAYRSITGGAEILDRSVWQQPHWREFFATGTIDLDLPLLGEKNRPTADGRTSRSRREIFVRRQDLEQFIATLSEPVTEQPEPVVTLTEQPQPEEKQQTSAVEEALKNPASPEQAPKVLSTPEWIASEAKTMKADGKIPAGIRITKFARDLADRMKEAAEARKIPRSVGWRHIKNNLRVWGLWPISKIK
jgi:hypothetical protein